MSNLFDEIFSVERYENNDLVYIDENLKDFRVKDVMSYRKWLENFKKYNNIKVEGLDNKNYHKSLLKDIQLQIKVNSVQLFFNQLGGFSFPKHTDDVNVFLYVIKGAKNVFIDDEPILIKECQGISIPKGTPHQVNSLPDTWALSIGYDE
jgi:mannose-6-phosphate isomerase-like protein (cupin superfamily)